LAGKSSAGQPALSTHSYNRTKEGRGLAQEARRGRRLQRAL